MERVDFSDDDINRCMVSYSNGARTWVNRGPGDWEVEGYSLPPNGYLINGPGGFLEYRARKEGGIADAVRSGEYDYYSCPKRIDFGPVVTDGALAIANNDGGPLVLYEVRKPTGAIELKLGDVRGTMKGQRAARAWAVLTRDRKIELTFPDLRQPTDPSSPDTAGGTVQIRPVEMQQALRYEVLLESPKPGSQCDSSSRDGDHSAVL
jgi:hypothetical protein